MAAVYDTIDEMFNTMWISTYDSKRKMQQTMCAQKKKKKGNLTLTRLSQHKNLHFQ